MRLRFVLAGVLALLASSAIAQEAVIGSRVSGAPVAAAALANTTLYATESINAPFDQVVACPNLTYCEDFFGTSDPVGLAAQGFFAGSPPANAQLLVTRIPTGGGRARLWSAPVQNQLSALSNNCPYNATPSLECEFDLAYNNAAIAAFFCADVSVNCGGNSFTTSLTIVAANIQTAINAAIFAQPYATTTGSSIAAASCPFTGYIINGFTEVTSTSSCTLYPGSNIPLTFGSDTAGNQIMNQVSGTPGGAGEYTTWWQNGSQVSYSPSATYTPTYGVLTIGTVTNGGTIAMGQAVNGAGVYGNNAPGAAGTGINAYISGGTVTCTNGVCSCTGSNCNGSTWVVSPSQTVASEAMNTISCPLQVSVLSLTGPSGTTSRFKMQQTDQCPYINPSGTMNFATNYGATQALMTAGPVAQGAGGAGESWPALLSPKGEVLQTYSAWLTNLVQYISGGFKYFQIEWDPDGGYDTPTKKNAVISWAAANTAWTYIPYDFETMQAASAYPPIFCTSPPYSTLFTANGTFTGHHCRALDLYEIGGAGASQAGVAGVSTVGGGGATAASGAWNQMLDMTTSADSVSWAVQVAVGGQPAAGNASQATPSVAGVITNNGGVVYAKSGGSASGAPGGTAAGGAVAAATVAQYAIGGTLGTVGNCTGISNGGTTGITGVVGCVTNTSFASNAGHAPNNTGPGIGGSGGPGAAGPNTAGSPGAGAGFAAGASGGGGDNGASGTGLAPTSNTVANAGGNGFGGTLGGAAGTVSGLPGNAGADATSGDGGGGGGAPVGGGGAGGNGGKGAEGPCANFGAGGGGAGGSANNVALGVSGAGGNGGLYGGAAGAGGGSNQATATGGQPGTPAGGALCFVERN